MTGLRYNGSTTKASLQNNAESTSGSLTPLGPWQSGVVSCALSRPLAADMNGRLCKLFITKVIRSTIVCDGSDFAELRGIRPFSAEKFGLGRWDGPLAELLASSNSNSRTNIKRRLIRAGLLENRCEECGLRDWLGERLTIQIDHINGIRDDYRLENLRMLCPNCHSQTSTYGRRPSSEAGLHERPGSA